MYRPSSCTAMQLSACEVIPTGERLNFSFHQTDALYVITVKMCSFSTLYGSRVKNALTLHALCKHCGKHLYAQSLTLQSYMHLPEST